MEVGFGEGYKVAVCQPRCVDFGGDGCWSDGMAVEVVVFESALVDGYHLVDV